jgi:hypothetical protein
MATNKIKLTEGTVYFLREIDCRSGAESSYCKIGRVSSDTEKRAKQHQTGNPREIVVCHELDVPAVSFVETLLHHQYAPYRVHGEWFEFSAGQVDEAFGRARLVSERIGLAAEAIEKAGKLSRRVSDGSTHQATDRDKAMHGELLELYKQELRLEADQERVGYQLKAAAESYDELDGVVEQRVVKKFYEAGFLKKYPHLGAKFLEEKKLEKTGVKGSFRVVGKTALKKLDEELFNAKKEAKKAWESGKPRATGLVKGTKKRERSHERLHEEYLELISSLVEIQLGIELSEYELQAACGRSDKIERVCSWERTTTARVEESGEKILDKAKLKKNYSVEYGEFYKPSSVTQTILPYRAYPLQ